jgi:uncharacterized Tic20 family protein
MITGSSQEELAAATQLSLRTIQRIENGETQPRGDSLKRLALALGVNTEELTRLMEPEEMESDAVVAPEMGVGMVRLENERPVASGRKMQVEDSLLGEDAPVRTGLRENKGFLMLLHLSALSYFLFPVYMLLPVMGVVVPLVLWLLKKDVIKGVQREGRKILNFQISWFLVFMIVVGNVFITKMLHVESVLDHTTMFRLLIGLYLFNVITVIVNIVRVGQDKAGIYRPAIPFMPNA